MNIDTPEGMAEAVSWLNAMIARCETQNLVWAIPRSLCVYTIEIDKKKFESVGHDRPTDLVLAAAGYTRKM